jgi:dihydrofolate synthase/folylpolyglutamate synthase
MDYQETCDYLFTRTPMFEKVGISGYKEGLDNTLALDKHFGHPHKNFRSIHVAGTNGKGSCAHTIAAILQECGYRVGLYTSPHLVDFRERIRINGQPIPETYVIDFVDQERFFFEPLEPSFFELTTAMAFKYFSEMEIDIAVIEVGLGGRLDCTNIITPILSVITNISLDHTQLLGNSLEQIAMEKAGIIKPGVPVVIGEALPETRPIFEAIAAEKKAPIIFAEDQPEVLKAEIKHSETIYDTRSYGTIIENCLETIRPRMPTLFSAPSGNWRMPDICIALPTTQRLPQRALRLRLALRTSARLLVCRAVGRWSAIHRQ